MEEKGREMARVRSTAEQLKRWLADLSIQIKLIGAYIVIILVPVIVISNYLFTGFYQNTIKDIIKENRYQTDNEKQEIMSRIGVMEQSIGLLVSDRQLREYVTVESEPGLNDIKRFQEYSFTYLQTVLFNNSDIANIHFFVNNPWISELWPIIYHEERIKDKPFYTKMLNQNGKILWEIQPEDAILQDSNDAVNPSSSSIVSLMAGVNQMNSQNLFQHLGIVKVDMPIGNFFKKLITTAVTGTPGSTYLISRATCMPTAQTRYRDWMKQIFSRPSLSTSRQASHHCCSPTRGGFPIPC